MDANFLTTVAEQFSSSDASNFDPFALNGIFLDEKKAFFCSVCKGGPLTLQDIPLHITKLKHHRGIENIHLYGKKINEHFTCKFCTEYVAADWKALVNHFREKKNHSKESKGTKEALNSQNSNISYITLSKNQIIECVPRTFFCCCCRTSIIGWDQVLKHIVCKQHKDLQKVRLKKIGSINFIEYECRKLVLNFIFHVSASTFHCYLCNCRLRGKKNCLGHFIGLEHLNNIFVGLLNSKNNITEHLLLNQNKSSLPESKNDPRSAIETDKISENSSSSSETKNSSESWETYEGPSQSYDSYDGDSSYSWQSSVNILDSWETLSMEDVISGNSDSTLFKVPENLIPLISQHHLQHLQKELICSLCNARLRHPQNIIDHTKSRRHIAKLKKYNINFAKQIKNSLAAATKVSSKNSPVDSIDENSLEQQMKKEADTSTQKDKAQKPKTGQATLMEIPENLIPLISEHMLRHGPKEIYCVACNARLQSTQSLIAHTKSRYHIAELKYYKAELKRKKKKLNALTSSSVSNAAVEKKKTDAVPSRPKLINIPKNFLPVLASDFLQNIGHEVICLPCNTRLQHVNTIKQHIKSGRHITELIKYKTNVLKKGESSATTSKIETNIITSPVTVVNEKSSSTEIKNNTMTSRNLTTNKNNSQRNVMKIPDPPFPPFKRPLLETPKKELYCRTSEVYSKHATSSQSHTKSSAQDPKLRIFTNSSPFEVVKTQSSLQSTGSKTSVDQIEPNQTKITSVSGNLVSLEDTLKKLQIKNGKASTKFKQRASKQSRTGKQEGRKGKGRSFDPRHMKIDMRHIYEMNSEKLRSMELSCQLCFPKSSNTIYCLICERSVARGFQSFYEHICSVPHMMYLAEIETNDELFINYPNQYSDLKLAKEYMQETKEQTIQCLACDESMKNDDIVIREHINADSHKERKQLWRSEMEKIFQCLVEQNKSTWYNTYKYYCEFCDVEFNTEFQFAGHMSSKRHKRKMAKIRCERVFDSCIPCATVFLGNPYVFGDHCEQPMHKYLVKTGDFSVCKLPEQALTLLKNAEPVVKDLIELSDQVSTVEKPKTDSLLQCLERTVKPVYPNAKAYPFGSRVSGLGFPDSDIDVFLDCGRYNGEENANNHQEKLIVSIERCLIAEHKSWEIKETLATSRTPIIKLHHRDTELSCDVSFKNGLSVENTKLLKCFIDNYPLCRKLMLFIKKWLSVCNLSGSQYITNYAMCWWIIFFLQTKSILPSIASMIAKENKSKIIDGWETGISETINVGGEGLTFTDLLHDFFVFYTNFDYHYLVACPLLGSTVKKEDFIELCRLPQEMAPYINGIKAKTINGSVELFRIDSEMCIQDPYDLSHNLTKAVRKFTLNRFRQLCALSAEILNNLKQSQDSV